VLIEDTRVLPIGGTLSGVDPILDGHRRSSTRRDGRRKYLPAPPR
jgi:hypothetical protein